MSMQNQWKLLSQLKDYLNKANYDKNQHIIVTKDWLDSLQKLTHSQLETIRKLSSGSVIADTNKEAQQKDNKDLENAKLTLMSEQAEPFADSRTVQPKAQQVSISKLDENSTYVLFVRRVSLRSKLVSKIHPTAKQSRRMA